MIWTTMLNGLNSVAIGVGMIGAGVGLMLCVLSKPTTDWWTIGNSYGTDADWRI